MYAFSFYCIQTGFKYVLFRIQLAENLFVCFLLFNVDVHMIYYMFLTQTFD